MAHSAKRLDFAKRFIRKVPLQTMEGGEGGAVVAGQFNERRRAPRGACGA